MKNGCLGKMDIKEIVELGTYPNIVYYRAEDRHITLEEAIELYKSGKWSKTKKKENTKTRFDMLVKKYNIRVEHHNWQMQQAWNAACNGCTSYTWLGRYQNLTPEIAKEFGKSLTHFIGIGKVAMKYIEDMTDEDMKRWHATYDYYKEDTDNA